jgi:hypothetical protein
MAGRKTLEESEKTTLRRLSVPKKEGVKRGWRK